MRLQKLLSSYLYHCLCPNFAVILFTGKIQKNKLKSRFKTQLMKIMNKLAANTDSTGIHLNFLLAESF